MKRIFYLALICMGISSYSHTLQYAKNLDPRTWQPSNWRMTQKAKSVIENNNSLTKVKNNLVYAATAYPPLTYTLIALAGAALRTKLNKPAFTDYNNPDRIQWEGEYWDVLRQKNYNQLTKDMLFDNFLIIRPIISLMHLIASPFVPSSFSEKQKTEISNLELVSLFGCPSLLACNIIGRELKDINPLALFLIPAAMMR